MNNTTDFVYKILTVAGSITDSVALITFHSNTWKNIHTVSYHGEWSSQAL